MADKVIIVECDDFEEELFKGHALGNNILGKKEGLNNFTKSDLESFVQSYFTKDNLVISFVGDVPFNKVVKSLEKYLDKMPNKRVNDSSEKFINYQPFNVIRKEANYQAHAIIGGMAPSYKDEERISMTLLMNILGGPALNSSLNILLREKHVLAYGVEANYVPYADIGFWQVYVGSESKNLRKAIALIKKELQKMQKTTISNAKLKKAKQQLKGQMALSMDSNSGLMHGFGKSFLAFGQIDTIQQIHNSIDGISAEQLKSLAEKYMDPSQVSILEFDIK